MSEFLAACAGQRTSRVPVWFMRQAGRSLPGYRKLREKYDVLELTRQPELAAEVSMEPIHLLGVDAAILFADIMLLPIALGIDVRIVENRGPVIDEPLVSATRLAPFDPGAVAFLGETIHILQRELEVPVIGFAGGPFTLASYLIEGAPTRDWYATKRFMLEQPEEWEELMNKLSEGVVEYLNVQIEAGAQAIQIFDSWVGALSPSEYRTNVLPHMQTIFSQLGATVPRIHFGTQTAGFLKEFASVECEVVGVDWRVDLAQARHVIGEKTLQGNLDPATLLCSWDTVKIDVDEMLVHMDPHERYIFNLGHGMPPQADNGLVRQLVEYVHTL